MARISAATAPGAALALTALLAGTSGYERFICSVLAAMGCALARLKQDGDGTALRAFVRDALAARTARRGCLDDIIWHVAEDSPPYVLAVDLRRQLRALRDHLSD